MFDPVTASFLRSAPALPGLDPATLPQTLTAHYADLVTRRLRGTERAVEGDIGLWPLTRIADAYELLTSIHPDPQVRRAAAFVAGTAQQLLSLSRVPADIESAPTPILDRDRVDPALAAAVLFLAAEQYADASEAARQIAINDRAQHFVATLVAEDIRDLASGNFAGILLRASRPARQVRLRGALEERGTVALLESILVGIELFAAEILGEPPPASAAGRFEGPRAAFLKVLELSSNEHASDDPAIVEFITTYPGPRHLASLLLSACQAIGQAAVTKVPPPLGVDTVFWQKWLRHRAATAPFVWQNHREALDKSFHFLGTSAVLILPTGAGKTTVSCIKIATVIASGKSVIFIAPTHALVEQLTTDLQRMFPEELLGSLVSSDFDRLFATGTKLRTIEIMTPEHCLALLSYARHAFVDVGLMVFDECHLLSPVSGLRRALDGMFCVLAFSEIAPDADFLFLSAMVRNGKQFSDWIQSLTGRACVFVDPLWKPSRQARGIVIYEEETTRKIRAAARLAQQRENARKGKPAKNLRAVATAELVATPFALFGLQHNWLQAKIPECRITRISDSPVELGGALWGERVDLRPNVNKVAGHIAVASARNGLKTIVFVNVKSHTLSTARSISLALGSVARTTADEEARWKALDTELGGRKHSLLPSAMTAVPHNSQMLRLERDLAEMLFRRDDGAAVIVATPTLAQGLNLPAHMAILASDMRADPDDGAREALEAHELLNAAARAGRAGHLANGIVLLIPEDVLTFGEGSPVSPAAKGKLKSILPEDDRCLDLADPLQTILDRISAGVAKDLDTEYALNRLSTTVAPDALETKVATRFPVGKSFAAFVAAQRKATATFDAQVAKLGRLLKQRNKDANDEALVLELAAQSGAPITVLTRLRERLSKSKELPADISGWVSWICEWLSKDEPSRQALLEKDKASFLSAVGEKVSSPFGHDIVKRLQPGILSWLSGKPLSEIEKALGGDPALQKECPRARHLVTRIVPLGLTFVLGLVAKVAQEADEVVDNFVTPRAVLECLPTAVRRGFDTPSKLAFAEIRKGLLSRVQFHLAYAAEIGKDLPISNHEDYASVVGKMRTRIAVAQAQQGHEPTV